jgi:hypothetical protein
VLRGLAPTDVIELAPSDDVRQGDVIDVGPPAAAPAAAPAR